MPQPDSKNQATASSLFGLAPCGVCPARAITGAAVRSYRTFSPLPPSRRKEAVYFLWHFPSSDPSHTSLGALPDVIRHTALRSSDFPPSSLDATRAAVRSGCLRRSLYAMGLGSWVSGLALALRLRYWVSRPEPKTRDLQILAFGPVRLIRTACGSAKHRSACQAFLGPRT